VVVAVSIRSPQPIVGEVPRVKAGSNTSTVVLRVVGGDEKETQYLELQLACPVSSVYKYGDLAL
jgi:hypothetical protein